MTVSVAPSLRVTSESWTSRVMSYVPAASEKLGGKD